ncbi:hypothetical protein D3C76_1284050 [compost metagenome]
MAGTALGTGATGLGTDDGLYCCPALVGHGFAKRPGTAVRDPGRHGHVSAVHGAVCTDALVVPVGFGAVAGLVHRWLDHAAQRLGLFVRVGRLHRSDHRLASDQSSAGGVRPGRGALYRDLPGDCLRHGDQRLALAHAR